MKQFIGVLKELFSSSNQPWFIQWSHPWGRTEKSKHTVLPAAHQESYHCQQIKGTICFFVRRKLLSQRKQLPQKASNLSLQPDPCTSRRLHNTSPHLLLLPQPPHPSAISHLAHHLNPFMHRALKNVHPIDYHSQTCHVKIFKATAGCEKLLPNCLKSANYSCFSFVRVLFDLCLGIILTRGTKLKTAANVKLAQIFCSMCWCFTIAHLIAITE